MAGGGGRAAPPEGKGLEGTGTAGACRLGAQGRECVGQVTGLERQQGKAREVGLGGCGRSLLEWGRIGDPRDVCRGSREVRTQRYGGKRHPGGIR